MLTTTAPVISDSLFDLFISSLMSPILSEWKLAKIILIPKPVRARTVEYYRSISVLTIVANVLNFKYMQRSASTCEVHITHTLFK